MDERWVVLRTQPRRESIAVRSIRARGVEAYAPQMPARGKVRPSPVFPGYLLARPVAGTDDLLLSVAYGSRGALRSRVSTTASARSIGLVSNSYNKCEGITRWQ